MKSDPKVAGDELMLKASRAFARQKLQRAYDAYGEAVESYSLCAPPPHDRMALAYYTRAMLVLRGDAAGDVGSDLDEGDRVAANDFDQARRFRGLFTFARASRRRMDDEFEAAQDLIDRARGELAEAGRPLDLFEVECEQARLDGDRDRREAAIEAVAKAESFAATPAHQLAARTLLADLHEAWGDDVGCAAALERAASLAFDHKMKAELTDLRARLKYYAKRDIGG